jgi:integrase
MSMCPGKANASGYSAIRGARYWTWDRAYTVLNNINWEIKNHVFDPQKYVKADLQNFWVINLLDRFATSRSPNLAPGYRAAFKHYILTAKEFFKNQDVRDVRKLHLINYKEYLEKMFPEWKPKTLKNAMDIFRTFMGYVRNDLELIDVIPPFPVVDVPETPFRWIGQKDQMTLFEKVPDQHKPIIAFLMLHGCRPGEARALKCKDVDLENGSITIAATFSGDVYCARRKGKRSKVLVMPIHPEIWDYVADRIESSLPEAFVFTDPDTGHHYREHKLPYIWDKVRKAAGISEELRLYDASRHSFASQLVNQGVSLFKVSRLLGHSTQKMSEKYSHASIEGLRTELSKISLKESKTVTSLSPEKTNRTK